MDVPRIILQKRKFLSGRRAWVLGVLIVIVLIGTSIQMKMTWNRERLRGITSDAADFLNAAKAGAGTVLPSKSELAPYIDLFNDMRSGSASADPSSTTDSPPVVESQSEPAAESATPTPPNN